MNTVAPV